MFAALAFVVVRLWRSSPQGFRQPSPPDSSQAAVAAAPPLHPQSGHTLTATSGPRLLKELQAKTRDECAASEGGGRWHHRRKVKNHRHVMRRNTDSEEDPTTRTEEESEKPNTSPLLTLFPDPEPVQNQPKDVQPIVQSANSRSQVLANSDTDSEVSAAATSTSAMHSAASERKDGPRNWLAETSLNYKRKRPSSKVRMHTVVKRPPKVRESFGRTTSA